MNFESELTQILEKEKALISELAECSKQKTDMLATGDLNALTQMLNKEQPLTLQCQAAETQRIAVLKKYRLENKTLRELCEMANEESREVLNAQLQELNDIVNEFKRINDLNNELTKSRLEFYGKLKSLYSKPVYGYNGAVSQKSAQSVSLIDRKI